MRGAMKNNDHTQETSPQETGTPADEHSKLKAVGDGAACAVGKIFEYTGYGAGRAAPAVKSVCRSLAELKAAQFIAENFRKGFQNGNDAAIEASARRQARRWLASGNKTLAVLAEELLADLAKFTKGAAPA